MPLDIEDDLPLPRQAPRPKAPLPKREQQARNPLIPRQKLSTWTPDKDAVEEFERSCMPQPQPPLPPPLRAGK